MRSPTRGRFEGVAQILRFNWPMYVAAAIVLALGAAAIFLIPLHDLLRVAASAALALAGFWLLVSLAVSHYVYDRAGIYRGEWLSVALPQEPRRYANLHAGFDEFSLALAARFPSASARVLDFFDPGVMTEPSIARARKVETGQPRAECVNFRSLPLADGELDAAFLIFAAHELRDPESRVALLRELARVLKPTGRVVISSICAICQTSWPSVPGSSISIPGRNGSATSPQHSCGSRMNSLSPRLCAPSSWRRRKAPARSERQRPDDGAANWRDAETGTGSAPPQIASERRQIPPSVSGPAGSPRQSPARSRT
jgi:SAM-dependent methyltransferase